MITEETIKQTRFYKGIDGKFYFVSEVEEVKVITLADCDTGEKSVSRLGDRAIESHKFAPVFPKFVGINNKRIAAAGLSRSAGPAGRKKKRVTSTRKSATGFLGVKEEKPYSDGRKRYSANYRKDGHFVYLGTFDNVYLAAAEVRKKKGDLAEAQRLRDMAEQAENNPDRPMRKKKAKMIWVCLRCGTEYKTDPTKSGCINCGHDDFREVPAE